MHSDTPDPRRWPILLALGILLLLFLQSAHFAHVVGWSARTPAEHLTLLIRANITPLAWCAYLLFLVGLLGYWDGTSWLRRYRNRFWICWLWSVSAWCYFDWMNFYFMRDHTSGLRAWEYINLPRDFSDRYLGYLVAFGAIAPGMFLTAELFQRAGFSHATFPRRTHSTPTRGQNSFAAAIFLLGILLAPVPILIGGPASNLAIWVGTWALLDPLNWRYGRPSIIGDWFLGRFGRTLALGAGGLACGFLWEFWNFWAGTKWTYHLPFLGTWEQIRFFEMPVFGLIGFIAFGIETWTMWQTALIFLAPFVEGERKSPADNWTRHWSCI